MNVFFVGVVLFGTLLNIWRDKRCFLFWLAGNLYFIVHNILILEYAQAGLAGANAALAAYGFWFWSKRK